jgi:hypothetical protein
MSEWESPGYGELEWEGASAGFGRNDGRIEITVRLRQERREPWPVVFDEVASADQQEGAGWSSVLATSSSVIIFGLQPDHEERVRDFVEHCIKSADALASKIVGAAGDMVEEFRRLSEYPPNSA